MSDLEIFDQQFNGIRKIWDVESDEWWYDIIGVVEVLLDNSRSAKYWHDLKQREFKQSGIQLSDFCGKFPMKHPKNNRTYQVECSNEEGILRIVQSIPSSKVELLKQWLAKTGVQRLKAIKKNPVELLKEEYRSQGYDEQWITARINTITTRNELTDEWKNRDIQGGQYGDLTNTIHRGTFDGMNIQRHKKHKGIKNGNLRDHMTPLELAFVMVGETMTTQIIRNEDSKGYHENLEAARRGGKGAGDARRTIEESTGEKVISDKSYIEERKRLLAHGTAVGKCDSCHNPVRESETYGTEAGNLCQGCFDEAVESGEINEDGEVL